MDYDPDLWLPDTIYLALGNTIELYSDNIAFVRITDSLLNFSWEHERGVSDAGKFQWTADRPGNMELKIRCYKNNELIDSSRTIIKVSDKINAGRFNILAIGNSLTNGGFADQFSQISNDVSCILNPIGTQGTNVKHEGHGGWRFSSFLSEKSPFFIGNTINFKKYIENNNFPDPDIIKISLGINDCFGKLPMDTIVDYASRLIDVINIDYPGSLIIIALPTLCEKTGSGFIANYQSVENFYPYQIRIRELWKRLYDKYSYGRYKPNIQVSYDGLCIDRTNGYPKNNGVHPNQYGYRQLARGFSNTLNYYLLKRF